MESVFDKLRGNNEEGGKVSQGISDFFYDVKEHKGTYRSILITSPIAGILLSGWFCQLVLKLFGKQDQIYIAQIFVAWLNTPGIILAALITFFFMMGGYRFHKITKKDYYVDREGKFLVSKQGLHGTAHWQTEKERDVCFNRSKNINNLLGDILGMDDEGRLYTLKDDLVGINRNKCVFGTPGSGKSAAIIENDILQCIRREESAIITDSKGDLYRRLSQKARDAGYVVRVLNLKSNELRNSDAFHLLKYLENGDTSVAEMLANCIIENTGDGHMDYWAQNELNGYKALLLYISTNEALKKAGRNTLAEMYNICTQNTPQQLATMFNGLPKTHPARQAFNIFANCAPDVQGQILNGMGIKLSFLTDFCAQQIVSHDEIDLILPMKQKCMYFVVIPDTNKTYNVIANLFFNMMLIKQCEYSDSLTTRQKENQLFVNYILDEFKATGAINNFDGTITTVRSRKIGITTVLQTLGQLKDMYPGEAYNTILGSMTVKILLRAGDEDTGRYFNIACGKQTRLNKAARYSDNLGETIHTHNSETITEGLIGADLLTIDETQKLDANKLIVCILGFEPVKLNKYLSKYNPYMEGCEDHERVPGRHKPLWRKRLEDAEKEKAETRKKFREASEVNKEETIEAVAVESENGIEYVNPQTGEAISMDASYETEDYSDQAFEYEPDAYNEQEEAPKERSLKRRDKFTRVNGNKELEKVLEKLG
ncbi:TraG protein (plasmid) [Butyrivibrio proteoclasticus B316]|uniref:TraG protein n=1 Tax=Butyrivibrio proteoclasticus (strain ATCC 51982 / DSM 14932 / B316) TaxID=515622 RepID=E0S4P7_BUTPB|nr:type IV secretory system conjugative DNA transfer family protein [Butyrivibrio proteoclasticus]ADL36379.1 TraG protein [Butyrivibrio proteoclasticus B316]